MDKKCSKIVLDDKARTALEGSIKKWEGILEGTAAENGQSNCPLCEEYFGQANGSCRNCPVYLKVRVSSCEDTPFVEWFSHQEKEHNACKERIIHCQTCKDLCEEEIAFLKGLLEEEEKPVDVVISFETQKEYKSFYTMLLRDIGIPTHVFPNSQKNQKIISNLMGKIRRQLIAEGRDTILE